LGEGVRNGKPLRVTDLPATLPFVKPARGTRSAKRLGVVQQRKFLELLLQGASPQVACHKLKVKLAAFWHTLEHDAEFAAALQQAWDTLSFNVMAALYQAAIKGNGPAQQFWLKHRPPRHWVGAASDSSSADSLESLSDDELLDRARTEAPDLAAEIEAQMGSIPGEFPPAEISGTGDGLGE